MARAIVRKTNAAHESAGSRVALLGFQREISARRCEELRGALATADARAAERDIAAAAILAAALEPFALALEHLAAGVVGAGAGAGAGVLGGLALARATAEVDLAAGDAVKGAAAVAKAVADHAAGILERRAGAVVVPL